MYNLVSREKDLSMKTHVIHNGLKPQSEDYVKTNRESIGFDNNDFIITLIGRINRLKGHKWLLSTFVNQFEDKKNIKLLFVGSPVIGQEYYLEEIQEIIKEKKLNNNIQILGFKKDLRPIFNLSDIIVVPSTEAESFGLIALEAMLAKKPLIASNHGGLREIIIHNETGFLVEPSNETQLATAIQKLFNDKDLRNSFANNGYERAINEFSEEKYVSSFVKLFER
jgi:glycosyltransferase involved in cell wall biosynthesis